MKTTKNALPARIAAVITTSLLTIGGGKAQADDKPAAAARPNIVLILADDLGWSALSCYGNRNVATPNLDRLAAQGMRFTQAYADAQCSPTRAALFSGQFGARSGMFKVTHEQEPPRAFMKPPAALLDMPPETATLASMLRKAGYTTGLSGKWHISGNYAAAALRERDGGAYFDRYGFNFCGPASEPAHAEDKAVTAITDDILGFIERSRDKPWFAYAAHFTTHTRLAAPKALVEKHAARGYKRTSSPTAKYAEHPTAEYLAMLEHFDNEIGRMMARLDTLGLAQNTLVIFTSDNGGLSRMASCAPLREGKGSPYEGGIRVPLIVRWPGKVKPGSQCDTPVHTVDFYPTLASVAGARVASAPAAANAPDAAARAATALDGLSLVPLLTQSGPLARDTLGWHMPTYTAMYGRTPCAVIRKGDWKLIHWFGDYLDPRGFTPDDTPYGKLVIGPRTELYNLRDDVSETRDLAAANPERAKELRAALEAWWRDTGAGFPTGNPDFDEGAWWGTKPAAPKAKRETKVTRSARGPRAAARFAPADIFQVQVGGEWAARRELIRESLLVWYPAGRDESKPPLDFRKDILRIWTERGTTAELRTSGNTYTGLGKTLEALVHFARETGDAQLVAQMRQIVRALCASQDADGYLGTVRRDPADPDAALWQVWNVHDGVYLGTALLEHARLFNVAEALAAARRYGDYLLRVWNKAPKRPGALSPVGITDFFFALHDATGEKRYLDFIADTPFDGRFIAFASLRDWRQELFPMRDARQAGAGGNADAAARNVQSKVHSYRYFARLIDQLRLREQLTPPDGGLFEMSRYTLEKIADADAPGVFITGANSRSEGWVEDQIGHGTVGEGCAVVHMVWWLAKLIEADGNLAYGDWIERAIFNHLEASQHPVSGRLRYDCHLSGARNFAKGAHCCDGNQRRFWADIERLIYYTFPGGLAVSLYTPSTACLNVNGIAVKLTQQTSYPGDGKMELQVEPEKAAAFVLRLRIPGWAKTHTVRVNGRPTSAQPVPGGIAIKRRWQSGDRVTLELPMDFLWVAGLKGCAGHAALMRGPQVFTLTAARNSALVGAAGWRHVTVAPATARLLPVPPADGARQPGEVAVKAWPVGAEADGDPPLEIVFSDFPAPDGRETYVTLADPAVAVRDPLLAEPDGRAPAPPTHRGTAPPRATPSQPKPVPPADGPGALRAEVR